MPQSITIAAFTFGAVLILLALTGGKIKFWQAEISEKVGAPMRVISFVLGAILLSFGLLYERPPNSDSEGEGRGHPSPSPTKKTPDDHDQRIGDPTPEPTPSPSTQIDIGGIWRDATGTIFQITQEGATYKFVGTNQITGYMSWGSGTIKGRALESAFRTNLPSTGTGVGTLSADGRQITGTVNDSALRQYVWVIYR